MPPLAPVPNVARVQLRMTDYSDTNVTTNFFYRYSGSLPDAATAQAIAASIATKADVFAPLMDIGTHITAVRVTDLSSTTGGDSVAPASVDGSRGNEYLAGATSLLVNYQINRRYRGGKPRVYLPFGIASDLQTRQAWTAGFLSAAQAAHDTYQGNVVGTTSGSCTLTAHVNVSYYEGFTVEGGTGGKRARNVSTPRATPLVDEIVQGVCSPVPSSQRRRNRG